MTGTAAQVHAPMLAPDPDLIARLEQFARCPGSGADVLPWADRLSFADQERLRRDLSVILSEPEVTAEPLDWRELEDILQEYSALAGWDGPLAVVAPPAPVETPYRVDFPTDDERVLARASAAVQTAVRELLDRFLPYHPTSGDRLPRGRIKKMGNRGVWQIDLPDGYRLRYLVADPEQTVYVVYLGPHPDGEADGREQARSAFLNRQRYERGFGEEWRSS